MDFITEFTNSTESTETPFNFRLWGAIYLVGALLERKVWVKSRKGALYPNLYIFLVAEPGIGKTAVTDRIFELLTSVEEIHVAPTNMTRAALTDQLVESSRQVPGLGYEYNSLQIISNEIGVLMPAYEGEFMNSLTDLYDCKRYTERKRSIGKAINLPHTQLSLLACATPAYLSTTIPEAAWDQGFLSRVILIAPGFLPKRQALFEALEEETEIDLSPQAAEIFARVGQIYPTQEAADLLDSHYREDVAPQPTHPRLQHYVTRRVAHLIKLSMIAAVASFSKYIEIEHVERAYTWLISAEHQMEDVFTSMNSGGMKRVADEVWNFVYRLMVQQPNTYGKEGVAEDMILRMLTTKVPSYEVERTMRILINAKILQRTSDSGISKYKAAAKRA